MGKERRAGREGEGRAHHGAPQPLTLSAAYVYDSTTDELLCQKHDQ